MSSEVRTRAVDKVARLAGRPTDLVTFWPACTGVISKVVVLVWAPRFFTHYEPRFRDNEQRVPRGEPVRGGPLVQATRPGRQLREGMA